MIALVLLWIIHVSAQRKPLSACRNTNRLCIEEQLHLNTTNNVYYPSTLIPIDFDPNSMILSLYYGKAGGLMNPCDISASLVQQLSVTPFTAGNNINGTEASFQLESRWIEAAQQDNSFFMVLRADNRQCLVGPDEAGIFASSVQIGSISIYLDLSSLPSATSTATPTNTDSQPSSVPADDNSFERNNLRLIVILVIAFVAFFLLVFALLAWRRKYFKDQSETRQAFESDEIATRLPPVQNESFQDDLIDDTGNPKLDPTDYKNWTPQQLLEFQNYHKFTLERSRAL